LRPQDTNGELDWDALYADQAPRVYNYFRFRVSSRADVEDLTSRTFERAWRSRGRYRRDLAGFSTWLFKIAHNVAIDHLQGQRAHLPLDAAADVAAGRASDLTRLATLIARLPDRERELIALKFGAAVNNRLIAQLTGISETNVGTILHRTVQSLDRQSPPASSRARLLRSLAAGLLVGASALALASFALRGELAGFHWDGWGRVRLERTAPTTEHGAMSGSGRGTSGPRGWTRNPWGVATEPPTAQGRGRPAVGGKAVVAIPQSRSAAPNATVAQYNSGAALLAPAPGEHLRIAVAAHADLFVRKTVDKFVSEGFNEPQVLVEPNGSLLANVCRGNAADFATPTRRMTAAESDACARLGVPMVEVKVGSEVVVFVRSKLYGALPLTLPDVYLALARTIPDATDPGATVPNRAVTWNEVNPALPLDPIQVLGPRLDSEPGQAFLSLVMEAGCNTFASLAALQSVAAHDKACRTVRDDGVYVGADPTPYPTFFQKLEMLPTAVGIVPRLFPPFPAGSDALVVMPVGGVMPTTESLEDGSYAAGRALYLYVNREHARRLSSMRTFLLDYLSAATSDGYLLNRYGEAAQVRARALTELGY
jgi:RNA polymerase sigma-70 factor, ECF subfamily